MHWSLHQEYVSDTRGPEPETEGAHNADLHQVIEYPSTRHYTLQELVESEANCYQFLQALYGEGGETVLLCVWRRT